MKHFMKISYLEKLCVYAIWLLLWQFLYLAVHQEVLIPSPYHTFQALGALLQQKDFYSHLIATVKRVGIGVGISFAAAMLTAFLGTFLKVLPLFLKPAVNAAKITPVMAIIILALLWLKSDQVPICVCFLMCYPIIYTAILEGIRQFHTSLEEMSRVFEVSALTRWSKCYLPQLKHYIQNALEISTGIGFKVVIAAEVMAIPRYAIGYQLLKAKIDLDSQQLFAWVLVVLIINKLCSMGMAYLFKWGAGA